MTEMRPRSVWIVSAHLAGGAIPASTGGAYANILVQAGTIDSALHAARDLCDRERYRSVEIIACRQLDLDDPEDGTDEVIRERALRVQRTGESVIATLHTFPRGN